MLNFVPYVKGQRPLVGLSIVRTTESNFFSMQVPESHVAHLCSEFILISAQQAKMHMVS